MQAVRINDIEVRADEFAWDHCHKLYVVTDQESRDLLEGYGYDFYPVSKLQWAWDRSCGLRFISSANLEETYVPQFHPGSATITQEA